MAKIVMSRLRWPLRAVWVLTVLLLDAVASSRAAVHLRSGPVAAAGHRCGGRSKGGTSIVCAPAVLGHKSRCLRGQCCLLRSCVCFGDAVERARRLVERGGDLIQFPIPSFSSTGRCPEDASCWQPRRRYAVTSDGVRCADASSSCSACQTVRDRGFRVCFSQQSSKRAAARAWPP